MQKTLLELVQYILSSLDSDEVNSITDTVESQQVAKIVETAYFDIVSRGGLEEHMDFFELDASGDSSKPTLMTRQDKIGRIDWLKYNKTDDDEDITSNFVLIEYTTPRDFFNLVHSFSTAESNVGVFDHVIDGDTMHFPYKNDKHPDYYTVFDDHTFLFDSYDASEDSTLQKSKTMLYGAINPEFTMSDAFIPDLDAQQFALLLNQAKVLAFAELKQTGHDVAALNARKQWINMKKTRSVIPPSAFAALPDYGRKTRY